MLTKPSHHLASTHRAEAGSVVSTSAMRSENSSGNRPGLKSVEQLFNEKFGGDFEARRAEDSTVLKRGAPTHAIMRNETEYVLSQASRIATGYKDLRKLHEDLLKELVLLQSQYDLYFENCAELAHRLECERKLAVEKLAESEQQRTSAILEAVKVKNQKKDVEAGLKQSREIELETIEWKQKLADCEARKREIEKRLSATELVASTQYKQVQAKKAELDQVTAQLLSMQKHQEEELQMQRAKYSQQLALARNTLASLREQEQVAASQLDCLQAERDRILGDIAKKQVQIKMQEEQAKKAAESLNAKDENVQTALQTLNKSNETSEQLLAQLKQEISSYWTKCEDATRECHQIQNDVSESASQITRLQARMEALGEQEREWKQVYALSESKYAEHAETLERCKQELGNKMNRVEEARAEKDAAVAALAQQQAQVAALQLELDQSKDTERMIRTELDVSKNALEKLKAPPPPPPQPSALEAELAAQEAAALSARAVIKNEYEEQIEALEQELASIRSKMTESDAKRRNLLNQVQTLKGNIRVLVRVAPLMKAGGNGSMIACSLDGMTLSLRGDNQRFAYNRVFDSETSQLEVFQEVSSVVQSALDGYHVCLFACGAAGTGKTFTMLGDLSCASARGIIPRSLDHILCSIAEMRETSEWTFRVECSFVEISETVGEGGVRDLFGAVKRITIHNCDADPVLLALQRIPVRNSSAMPGEHHHRVFSVHLHGRNEATRAELAGSLHLCDLATAASTGGSNMLALASALRHQGFKSSPLTDLLKPCLSGEGKTLMIATVGAGEEDLQCTGETLRFAQQVNQAEPGNNGARRGGH